MTITQVITQLPASPNINTDTPDQFNAKAIAHLAAQNARDPQIAAWTNQVNSTAADMSEDAEAAAASAVIASNKASDAATSASNAAALAATAAQAAAASKWNAATAYSEGNAVWSPTDYRTYRRKTNGTSATDPANDPVNWASMAADTVTLRKERSSNTQLTVADNRCEIVFTSGGFTQTFAACALLGNGWVAWLINDSNGKVTLDPNGSETIDNLSGFVMLPGEARRVHCDGTALHSVVLRPFYFVDTDSGNFPNPVPPGYRRFDGEMWAGGGSGGKYSSEIATVHGGSGGAHIEFSFTPAQLTGGPAYYVGEGGAPQTAINQQLGNLGGNSSFKGLYAGAGYVESLNPYGGKPYFPGFTGAPMHEGLSPSNVNGRTIYGGEAGASILSDSSVPSKTGQTVFGGAGGATDAAPGVAPGGGGAATRNGAASGAGARGEFRIWGVA